MLQKLHEFCHLPLCCTLQISQRRSGLETILRVQVSAGECFYRKQIWSGRMYWFCWLAMGNYQTILTFHFNVVQMSESVMSKNVVLPLYHLYFFFNDTIYVMAIKYLLSIFFFVCVCVWNSGQKVKTLSVQFLLMLLYQNISEIRLHSSVWIFILNWHGKGLFKYWTLMKCHIFFSTRSHSNLIQEENVCETRLKTSQPSSMNLLKWRKSFSVSSALSSMNIAL